MLQFANVKIILVMASFIVLICTIICTRSKSFEIYNLGLVFTSALQGLLLSLIFPTYLLYAPILALLYYIFFSYFWAIIFLFKSRKFEEYKDEKLLQALREIPEIKKFEFKLRKYSEKGSFNAIVTPFIPIISLISNKYMISLGEELISKLTLEEKVVVLAHEIGHALKNHMSIKSFLFCLVLIGLVFLSFIVNLLILTYARSYFRLFDYIITFTLLIIGIIIINRISWYFEYDADKKALQLTNDIKNFKSANLKLQEASPKKNYGKVINLIVYTHPLLNDRIKKGQSFFHIRFSFQL